MSTTSISLIGLLTAVCSLQLAHGLAVPPAGQVPYTLYQLPLQDNFKTNQANIKGKPYEKYFRPDLFVYPEMIEPGRTPIDCETQALDPKFSDISKLLVPAETTLANENAWCAYKTGQGYVSSRTHLPKVTGDMAQWWFWWHSAESARYSLWHPWAHISVESTYVDRFDDPSLTNKDKLIGSVHHVVEIIGEPKLSIDIHWKNASFFGLDESKFAQAGIVAQACGQIFFGGSGTPLKAADMIHLFYKKKDGSGVELRSRYFLASNIKVEIPILGSFLPINAIASAFGIKKAIVGPEVSYLQFHHDQQEFTHLASILPDLYKEFGNGAK